MTPMHIAQQHITSFFTFHIKNRYTKENGQDKKKKRKINTKKRICIVNLFIHTSKRHTQKKTVLQLLNKEWKEELWTPPRLYWLCHFEQFNFSFSGLSHFPECFWSDHCSTVRWIPLHDKWVNSHLICQNLWLFFF